MMDDCSNAGEEPIVRYVAEDQDILGLNPRFAETSPSCRYEGANTRFLDRFEDRL
jgi:hypothetical protein